MKHALRAIALLLTVTTFANAGEIDEVLRSLLTSDAGPSKESLAAARETYKQAKQSLGDNALIDYAFAIALIRQERYEESLKPLKNAVEGATGQTRRGARRARIWIYLLQNHPTQALKEVDALGHELQSDQGDKAAAERLAATIRFIGQAFAYLEGPLAAGVKADMVAKSKEAFLKQLRGDGEQAFQAGFDDGSQRLAGAAPDSTPSQASQPEAENLAKLKDSAQELKERKAADLARQKEEAKQIAAKSRELAAKYQDILNRIANLELQIAGCRARISNNDAAIKNEKNQAIAAQKQRENEKLRKEIADYEAQVATLLTQSAALEAQDQSLLQQKQSRASDNKRANLADKREAAELKKKEHAAEAKAHAELAKQHVAQVIAYLPFPYDSDAEWILKAGEQP